MTDTLHARLLESCRVYPSMLVAFSGGVDSTLLAWAAREAVPGEVRLVFCRSPLITAREQQQAEDLAAWLGLPLEVLRLDVLDLPQVASNQPERCYYCKLALFTRLQELAAAYGLAAVADGTNADDKRAANRPGSRACAELGIAQPLAEAGLNKQQIRLLAREAHLPNHAQAARPCLATRFPYQMRLSPALLQQVAEGEELLRGLGLSDFRLRSHGDICRIEAEAADMPRLLEQRRYVEEKLTALGWRFITLDLGGLSSGTFDK